jgi:hypothetical protein
MGQGAHTVDAGVSADVHQHHLAPELIAVEGRGIQPGRPLGQRRQRAQHRQAAQGWSVIAGGILRRDPGEQGLLEPVGIGRGPAGEGGRLQTQGAHPYRRQHGGPQPAPHPEAGPERPRQGHLQATAGQECHRQGGGSTQPVGQQQQGGVGASPPRAALRPHRWARTTQPPPRTARLPMAAKVTAMAARRGRTIAGRRGFPRPQEAWGRGMGRASPRRLRATR